MANERELTPKQERFCREYVIDLNGTQAAIRAGYSEKTSNEIAAQLLAKLSISQRIKELQTKIANKLEITAEMVLSEFAKIGFSNIQDYIHTGFKISQIQSLKKEISASIQSVDVETRTDQFGVTQNVKFKLYDKVNALVNIGKHIGFFEKDNKLTLSGEQVAKFGSNTFKF